MKRLPFDGATFLFCACRRVPMYSFYCHSEEHSATIPLMKGARGMLTPNGLSCIDYRTESAANVTSPFTMSG